MIARCLVFLVLLAWGATSFAAERDIVGFCKAQRDLDRPGLVYFGKAFQRDRLPGQVEDTGATDWRCMGGKVFLCQNSADGAACAKLDASRTPRPVIREICRDAPGTESVARYATAYSASTWRCDGTTPKIIQTFPLDRRGFLAATWVEYVGKDGAVVSPAEDDFGVDPR